MPKTTNVVSRTLGELLGEALLELQDAHRSHGSASTHYRIANEKRARLDLALADFKLGKMENARAVFEELRDQALLEIERAERERKRIDHGAPSANDVFAINLLLTIRRNDLLTIEKGLQFIRGRISAGKHSAHKT